VLTKTVRNWFLATLCLCLSGAKSAARLGCEEKPLLDIVLTQSPSGFPESLHLGEWPLPISLSNSTPMKFARVSVDLNPSESGEHLALFAFQYRDPDHPYGIPYSFQAIEWEWWAADGSHSTSPLDLSAECSQVGRSLQPGQTLKISFPVHLWTVHPPLKLLRIRIWGGRG
jgi:hypothetical protein